MKAYVTPTLSCVELRVEERIASNCTGSCTTWEVQNIPTMVGLIALSDS
jgi:hypothetical protein